MNIKETLDELGIREVNSGVFAGQWIEKPSGGELVSFSPINGEPIARVLIASERDLDHVLESAQHAFRQWRMVPAPTRGEIVRQIGLALREKKSALGRLVTLEMGKILPEGEGEVQEMIDISDFVVGLSRQLYGLTMASERPLHRLYEQWHPLGPVGVITAFNFPVAVWSWNALLAAVCGDTIVWKPSSQVPLCAIAVQNIVNGVLSRNGYTGVMNLVIGSGDTIGERFIADRRVPLISATGSCPMGKRVAEVVSKRLGRTILELGGNNAVIIMDDADLDLAVRAVLFGAVGTAGQRCTTIRRLILHKRITRDMTERLVQAYGDVPIGNPLEPGILMGPMVSRRAVEDMMRALERIRREGGKILYGGKLVEDPALKRGCYVQPALVKARKEMPILQEEVFAPILYVIEVEDLPEALEVHNDVPQGLSSAIFTDSLRTAETFLGPAGSDCGIANVNIGTSGAEIGGAFGGEKDTGGGREAGSDSWKAYMRRQTVTINWSRELPLAQGIKFGN
ncbi:MAG: aldehyde dehydrogenase family protein [Deltaproteobacteria bacterium]|nr:aldehyde dehydrogenase family protein [Deltaproteobacteria bacterium]